jgi:hypothetical protein
MKSGWLAVPALAVALYCYDLYDAQGAWRGVAFVNEDEWRFEVFDPRGHRMESGAADAFLVMLRRLGLVEKGRSCTAIYTPCLGRATRC